MGRRGTSVAAVCVLALVASAAPASAAAPSTVNVDGVVPDAAPVLVPSLITRTQGWSFSAIATADIDGDGRRDVVALDPQRRGVVIARSLRGGRFATRRLPRLFGPDTGGGFPGASARTPGGSLPSATLTATGALTSSRPALGQAPWWCKSPTGPDAAFSGAARAGSWRAALPAVPRFGHRGRRCRR